VSDFDAVVERAAQRKGGLTALQSMLPERPDPARLSELSDAWILGEMTRSIFQSGFVWRVINNKWPGFKEAFYEFRPEALMGLSEDDWQSYLQDTRIVRNRQKIWALRHNLWFVNEVSAQQGGFGRFLGQWPTEDLVGLFAWLKKRGSRLGGNTGQYFLQQVGVDSFALTRDVVSALQMSGLDIHDNPVSLKDLKAIQQRFNDWAKEGGWSYRQMSFILAYSAGDNDIMPGAGGG